MIKQIFFDVDGTCISKDDQTRPGVLDVMKFCHSKNVMVMMWSGGGFGYAKTWAKRIDPNGEAHIHVVEKTPGTLITGQMMVDDMKEMTKLAKMLGAIGYWVPFYEPLITQNDNEMYKLKEFLERLL